MKKVIGIVSWLPNNSDHTARFQRVKRLIKQLQELFPTIPVVVLAQNWLAEEQLYIKSLHNNVTIHATVERLGILKARKQLRQYLLATSYDYFILFDDDAIIVDNGGKEELLRLIDANPIGWAFSTHQKDGLPPAKYNPFSHSQLNLCCLSRYIFEKEDFPNVDPEKSEGFEDRIYSMTLLCKYPFLRFSIPETIYCDHFKNEQEPTPSTWARRKKYNWKKMRANTEKIEEGLMKQYEFKNN